MFKRRFRLPSPALVISLVTLSLVLGGTAVAATTAGHKDAKADKKLVKKLAPSLSVKHAKTANSATTAASATNATNATNATHAASATNATTAANANALQGHPASDFLSAGALNKFHVVMAPGAADQVIDHNGVLSLVAHCDTTGPEADLYVRSTADHTAMDAWDQNNDFGPADTTVLWAAPVGPSAPNTTFEANVDDGVVVAPDGSFIAMVSNGVGFDMASAPGKCVFVGANVNG